LYKQQTKVSQLGYRKSNNYNINLYKQQTEAANKLMPVVCAVARAYPLITTVVNPIYLDLFRDNPIKYK
jgi:hypothetical protein